MCLKGTMAKQSRPVEQAKNISQQLADSLGYEHLDTAFEKEAAGVYLRVYLDKPGGMDLNDCEAFHRAVQDQFERFDYDFLEVCSAGIDRPIKNERDAQKAMGQQVEIRLFKPISGRKEFVGTLVAYDAQAGFTITQQGETRQFAPQEVALARRTVDLSVLDMADDESPAGTALPETALKEEEQ